MGLELEYINFISKHLNRTSGTKILELGNQHISLNDEISYKTGKEYYQSLGYEHTSVDINGLDGSLPLDLRNINEFVNYSNYFDIITNSGTTEHVEPFDKQYECFNILHMCCRTGGLVFHLVPDVEERDNRKFWKKHCRIYYSSRFFETLSQELNYKILENKIINGLRCVAMMKLSQDHHFTIDKNLFLNLIDQRNV